MGKSCELEGNRKPLLSLSPSPYSSKLNPRRKAVFQSFFHYDRKFRNTPKSRVLLDKSEKRKAKSEIKIPFSSGQEFLIWFLT